MASAPEEEADFVKADVKADGVSTAGPGKNAEHAVMADAMIASMVPLRSIRGTRFRCFPA